MAPTADFDPSVPAGTDLLRNGAARIRSVTEGITILFGGNGVDPLSLGAPFSFFDAAAQAAGRLSVMDPMNPQEIATKHLIDQKLIVAADVNGDGVNYSGLTVPDITAYDTGALYLVALNAGAPTNMGTATLQLGTLGGGNPPKMWNHPNGSALATGDLIPGQWMLVAYDGTAFRILNFFGGSLAADPTVPLGAATKQYVDQVVNPPATRGNMSASTVPLTAIGADLITTTVNVPSDGTYVLHVDFLVYVLLTLPQEAESDTAAWITDGANFWAFAGNAFRNGTTGNGDARIMMGGAGFAPTSYAAGSAITLKLQAAQFGPGTTAVAQQTKFTTPGSIGPSTLPQTYLTATLMRSHT